MIRVGEGLDQFLPRLLDVWYDEYTSGSAPGMLGGVLTLVVPLLDKYDLVDVLSGNKKASITPKYRLTERLIFIVIKQLLHAVDKLHKLGICHFDIKCDNIAFRKDEDTSSEPRIVLFDLGMAEYRDPKGENCWKARDPSPWDGVWSMGTLRYNAPEMLFGREKRIGPSCDVWAIGCVLHELMNCMPAFEPLSDSRDDFGVLLCDENSLPHDQHPGHFYNSFRFVPVVQDSWNYEPTGVFPILFLRNELLEKDPARRPTIPDLLDQTTGYDWLQESFEHRIVDIYTAAFRKNDAQTKILLELLTKGKKFDIIEADILKLAVRFKEIYNESNKVAIDGGLARIDTPSPNREGIAALASHDGGLGKVAFRNFLGGVSLPEELKNTLFEMFDDDKNKTIDFGEFMLGLLKIIGGHPNSNEYLFQLCDINNDGKITPDGFKQVFGVEDDNFISKVEGMEGANRAIFGEWLETGKNVDTLIKNVIRGIITFKTDKYVIPQKRLQYQGFHR